MSEMRRRAQHLRAGMKGALPPIEGGQCQNWLETSILFRSAILLSTCLPYNLTKETSKLLGLLHQSNATEWPNNLSENFMDVWVLVHPLCVHHDQRTPGDIAGRHLFIANKPWFIFSVNFYESSDGRCRATLWGMLSSHRGWFVREPITQLLALNFEKGFCIFFLLAATTAGFN